MTLIACLGGYNNRAKDKHGATLCLGFCLGFESAVSVGGVLGLLNELNSDSL